MKFTITSAVLGAAAVSQAASIHHGHAHMHARRTPAASLEQRDPAVLAFAADATSLTSKMIQAGTNAEAGTAAVGVGAKGPFQIRLQNKGKKDVTVVTWSGNSKQTSIDACFVGTIGGHKPDVSYTIKAGANQTIGFDPSHVGGQISGGLAPVYDTTTLTQWSGQIDNTWVEYTFTSGAIFSTTDVSRLINMKGNKIEVHNYPDQAAVDAKQPACSSTMSSCSFICPDGQNNCNPGKLQDCAVGTAGTTASASGYDGGCGGMPNGGIVEVNFFDEVAS